MKGNKTPQTVTCCEWQTSRMVCREGNIRKKSKVWGSSGDSEVVGDIYCGVEVQLDSIYFEITTLEDGKYY